MKIFILIREINQIMDKIIVNPEVKICKNKLFLLNFTTSLLTLRKYNDNLILTNLGGVYVKKKLLSIGLTAILTIVGASSALAVPGDSTAVTALPNASDQTRGIAGADTNGKITLQSRGSSSAYLWESCPGNGKRMVDLSTSSSKTEDSSVVYMKTGCTYYGYVTSNSSSSATLYLRNYN